MEGLGVAPSSELAGAEVSAELPGEVVTGAVADDELRERDDRKPGVCLVVLVQVRVDTPAGLLGHVVGSDARGRRARGSHRPVKRRAEQAKGTVAQARGKPGSGESGLAHARECRYRPGLGCPGQRIFRRPLRERDGVARYRLQGGGIDMVVSGKPCELADHRIRDCGILARDHHLGCRPGRSQLITGDRPQRVARGAVRNVTDGQSEEKVAVEVLRSRHAPGRLALVEGVGIGQGAADIGEEYLDSIPGVLAGVTAFLPEQLLNLLPELVPGWVGLCRGGRGQQPLRAADETVSSGANDRKWVRARKSTTSSSPGSTIGR